MPFQDYPDFAQTDEEAELRFNVAKRADPFPDIPPSLLNSAHIEDYVRATGMLFPFHPDPEMLKSASYEAAICGRCIYWDPAGTYNEVELRHAGDEFTLLANSIAFVQIEPFFRLPDYMALRFNLKITHVHRGILLGTGPLVDPGFVGRLLIPLHNLTTNDYRLKYGEGLIWIEFTKTSPLPKEDTEVPGGAINLRARYHRFDPRKSTIPPEEYLRRASPHKPIQSSIPTVWRESRLAARRAERFVKIITAAGLLGLVIAVLGVLIPTWGLIQDATRSIQSVEQQLREIQVRNHEVNRKTEEQIQSLRAKMGELERRMGAGTRGQERQDGSGEGAVRGR